MGLVNRMREAILEQRYPEFCRQFLAAQFPNPTDIPSWVVDALGAAGISMESGAEAASNMDFTKNIDQLRKNSSFDPTEKKDLWNELKREWDASFQELDEIHANANEEKLDKWFDRLYQQHNESGRYYHTTVHLMEMMRYWNAVVAEDLSLSKHSPAICWATFFHDSVYDPKSSTNEEDSAKLFEEFCSDAMGIQQVTNGDDDNRVAKVASLVSTLILATKKHEVIPNEMMPDAEIDLQMVFLDIDMSVLGKHENAYLAYAGCIRKEHSFVEESVYCEKRAEVLTGFLENKKQIFLSDLFHKTSEAQARSNLKREIELLKQGSIPGWRMTRLASASSHSDGDIDAWHGIYERWIPGKEQQFEFQEKWISQSETPNANEQKTYRLETDSIEGSPTNYEPIYFKELFVSHFGISRQFKLHADDFLILRRWVV